MAEVVLINANTTKPAVAPLGLEYIAEACQDQDIEVEVIDLCFAEDLAGIVSERLSVADPKLVGVSLRNTDDSYMLSAHSFIPGLAKLIRSIRDTVATPIVLGGAGFSVAPTAIMKRVGADYGVVGDGEQALPLLVDALQSRIEFCDVPGLLWHTDDEIRSNRPAWPDISGKPGLRRDSVDTHRYFQRGGQLGLETKRGCNRRCIYCADPLSKGHRLRLREPAAVADEITNLLDQDCNVYHLCDSEFNVPEAHARAVCEELIRRRLNRRIRWYAYLSPHPFSEELADLMQQAGCAGIDFGADSGNDEMLHRLGRAFSHEDIGEAVRICRDRNIPVMLDLLIGAPGETQQTASETISVAKSASPSCVGISLGVRIYAGTKLVQMLADDGPLDDNPAIWGPTTANEQLLDPVFYLSPELGSPQQATSLISEMIGGDQRFFFGGTGDDSDYSYDDNQVLVEAITSGARGAYWDILRRLRLGS